MSGRRLGYRVLGCVIWLIIYGVIYAGAVFYGWDNTKEVLKSLILLALAVPAAILTHAFSRRNSYFQALRDLWQRLIPAVQKAIQYTHLTSPNEKEFATTMEELGTAIDMVRGVFSNVRKKKGSRGLYPYENLKDIHKLISWLGYGSHFRTRKASITRTCITSLWQEMHFAMLDEFDRDIPATPVSKYFDKTETSVADLLIKGRLSSKVLKRVLYRTASPSAPLSKPSHGRKSTTIASKTVDKTF